MPLTAEQQRQVDVLQEKNPDMGRRTIASHLDLSEKQVRNYLETKAEESYERPSIRPVRIVAWDLETTDFKPDIGRIVIASFYDFNDGTTQTRTALDYASEQEFVTWVADQYEAADVLVGHNSVSFDKVFLTGVMGRVLPERHLAKRVHWDTYLIARYGWKGGVRYSLENLADHFGLPMQKDKPSKHDWREMIHSDPDAVRRLVQRCESDVHITAMLMLRMIPYLHKWKGNA